MVLHTYRERSIENGLSLWIRYLSVVGINCQEIRSELKERTSINALVNHQPNKLYNNAIVRTLWYYWVDDLLKFNKDPNKFINPKNRE